MFSFLFCFIGFRMTVEDISTLFLYYLTSLILTSRYDAMQFFSIKQYQCSSFHTLTFTSNVDKISPGALYMWLQSGKSQPRQQILLRTPQQRFNNYCWAIIVPYIYSSSSSSLYYSSFLNNPTQYYIPDNIGVSSYYYYSCMSLTLTHSHVRNFHPRLPHGAQKGERSAVPFCLVVEIKSGFQHSEESSHGLSIHNHPPPPSMSLLLYPVLLLCRFFCRDCRFVRMTNLNLQKK